MSITLTPEETDTLQRQYVQLTNSIATRQAAVDAQDGVIADAENADNAEKKVFDFYDEDIIRQYENEREQLDGSYQESPVTKAELDDLGALNPSNRLYPTLPQTAPLRISEFDGGGLVTTDNEIIFQGQTVIDSEPFRITKQLERQDWLANGLGGTMPVVDPTALVVGAIDQNTTTIEIQEDPGGISSFAVGDRFLVVSGSEQIGIEITSITSTGSGTCDNPIYTDQATCELNGGVWTPTGQGFELGIIVLTTGSVAAGGSIDELWSGFSNADRINKNDATDGYNYLLNELTNDLEAQIDSSILKLNTQKTALEANQDINLDPDALIDVNTQLSVLNTWKVNKDVDDDELSDLENDAVDRQLFITSRIAAIEPAKAAYYDLRYTSATNIGDTSRGTARILIFRRDTKSTTEAFLQSDIDQRDAVEDTLTLAGEEVQEV
jgi:hypothetical protein